MNNKTLAWTITIVVMSIIPISIPIFGKESVLQAIGSFMVFSFVFGFFGVIAYNLYSMIYEGLEEKNKQNHLSE
jgi:hypothetical protein